MATQRVNFRPVSDVISVTRRDVVLADPQLVNPNNAASLLDGEWMSLDGNGKCVRAVDVSAAGNELAVTKLAWPVWAENGRTDLQARAERGVPLLWLNDWEFETRIFDAGAAVGGGAAITAIMQPIKVASLSIGGEFGTRIVSGLVGHGGKTDTNGVIVGYVTKLPASNSGWLRIRGGNLF